MVFDRIVWHCGLWAAIFILIASFDEAALLVFGLTPLFLVFAASILLLAVTVMLLAMIGMMGDRKKAIAPFVWTVHLLIIAGGFGLAPLFADLRF
ncbi:MAG: hypothetical protein AAFY99_15305 [Pseudomonadota bacterium]